MAVFDALRDALGALRRRPMLVPLLVLAGLPLTVLNALGLYVESGRLLGRVGTLFLAPFLLGGSYGVAMDALDDRPVGPASFVGHGTDNYLSILGATLLLYGGAVVAGVALGILLLIPVLNILLLFVLVPVAIVAALVLQFVQVAVVVADETAISTYRRSYRVATDNLGTVFGYSLLRVAIGLVFLLPAILAMVLEMSAATNLETYTAGPTVTAALVLFSLSSAVLVPFHVAFFQRIAVTQATRVEPDPNQNGVDSETAPSGTTEQDQW